MRNGEKHFKNKDANRWRYLKRWFGSWNRREKDAKWCIMSPFETIGLS